MSELQVCTRGGGVAYEAPGHRDITMHRLIGPGAVDSGFARLMRLEYADTGDVDFSASVQEKIYICISGEVIVCTPYQELLLRAGDVCLVPPGCARSIRNQSSGGSELLLIMPR